jgi:RNA polymerase sigma factor (sigma-70 family)
LKLYCRTIGKRLNQKQRLLSKEITGEELKIVRSIAKRFAYKWRTIDSEDLTSELLLWILEHYATVDNWRYSPGGEGQLVVSLRRIAARYCARETSANINKPLDTDFYYTIEQIERGLPFIWQDRPQTTGHYSKAGSSADSTNALAVIADLSSAFYSLNRDWQTILEWRYRLELNLKEIGDLLGISDRAVSGRINRALARLQIELGGSSPRI